MRTIIPCYLKVTFSHICPNWDCPPLPDLFVLLMSEMCFATSTMYIMPPFVPNQFMLDTHDEKG